MMPTTQEEWMKYLVHKVAEVFALTPEDLEEMGIRTEYRPDPDRLSSPDEFRAMVKVIRNELVRGRRYE